MKYSGRIVEDTDNPYLLLTPGPLSTSRTVKEVMLRDWCTWDAGYNLGVVTPIRETLVGLATSRNADFTSVLMQGSGTFSVESVIGSVIPRDGKLLVLANGAYGQRMATISRMLDIQTVVHDSGELAPPDLDLLNEELSRDSGITHVAVVHGETTTGMLNPIEEIGRVVKRTHGRTYIVDAMSTFGGIPLDIDDHGIDFIVSSANKCIQGVPGFGFVVARRETLESCEGFARSHSLDLFDQWRVMEEGKGKWRFTSPTHVVRAFAKALEELEEEGGIAARHRRYRDNHRVLVEGMEGNGFRCLLPQKWQSPIITSFFNPDHPDYSFGEFYSRLKKRGFVIYPGKVTDVDTFRIGTIGDVRPSDFHRLIEAVGESLYWTAEISR